MSLFFGLFADNLQNRPRNAVLFPSPGTVPPRRHHGSSARVLEKCEWRGDAHVVKESRRSVDLALS